MAVNANIGDGQRFVVLASLDADWNYLTTFPDYTKGIRVRSMQFVTANASLDICYLKDGSDTGPEMFYSASPNNHAINYYNGKLCKPYFDVSICTITDDAITGAKIILNLGGFEE